MLFCYKLAYDVVLFDTRYCDDEICDKIYEEIIAFHAACVLVVKTLTYQFVFHPFIRSLSLAHSPSLCYRKMNKKFLQWNYYIIINMEILA